MRLASQELVTVTQVRWKQSHSRAKNVRTMTLELSQESLFYPGLVTKNIWTGCEWEDGSDKLNVTQSGWHELFHNRLAQVSKTFFFSEVVLGQMAVKSVNLTIASLTRTPLPHIRFTHPASQCAHQLVCCTQIIMGLNDKSGSDNRDPKTNPAALLLAKSSQPNWEEREGTQTRTQCCVKRNN